MRIPCRNDIEESEANQFAMELLIPEHLLRKDMPSRITVMDLDAVVPGLAKRYAVDRVHMTFRLIDLGLVR